MSFLIVLCLKAEGLDFIGLVLLCLEFLECKDLGICGFDLRFIIWDL